MRVKEPDGPWQKWQTASTLLFFAALLCIFAGMIASPCFFKYGRWAAIVCMLFGLFCSTVVGFFAIGCAEHSSNMLSNMKQQKREEILDQENVNGMGI